MKIVNQQVIKNNNLKMIYRYIQQESGISRAQLAKLSGLSKTTVSSLVDELISRRFIQDTGTLGDATSVGRKPNGLQLLQGQYYIAVISWNKRDISAKLIDICGMIMREVSKPVNQSDSYVILSKTLFDELITSEFSLSSLLGIVIIVPAMLDSENKEIFTTTLNLYSNGNEHLLEDLKDSFSGFPLAVLNDTACAAYAEKIYTRIPQKDFAYINFQHGIGAALFIQDKLLGQATASYTQFGHYCIDPNGPPCSCGNKGCLEVMISENSIKERLKNAHCCSPLALAEKVTYSDLSFSALYGDVSAQNVIHDIAKDFSLALSNLICIVHPKLIIIGGKGKDLGLGFLEEVKENLKATGFRKMIESLQIRYSFLDSTAYFVGAMKYFFDIHYNFTQMSSNTFFIG